MRPITTAVSDLRWIHPEVTERIYELRDGEGTVARLSWESSDGAAASGRSAAGSWTLRRLGFLNPHVVALDSTSGRQVFRFDATMNGGGLAQAEDGHQYRWYSNLWRAEWGWIDTAGNDLLKFRRSFDVDEKQEGHLEVLEAGARSQHVDLLALVGWYLIIMIAESHA